MKTRMTQFFHAGKKRIAVVLAGLTAASLAIANVDSIATTLSKWFGTSADLPALDNPINRAAPAPSKDQTVQLELVQTPKEQDADEHIFDIYLKNNGSEDVLLTKIVYGDGYFYTSAGLNHGGSHKLAPDSSYEIPVTRTIGESALSPPYLLKGMSRGAVRFRFLSHQSPTRFGANTLAFEIYDSADNKVAAVNALRGK